MGDKKRIIIIDDHPLFREGLKTILGRSDRYDVVGEAGNADLGLKTVKEIKPDLAIVDISLPDRNGIELARDILKCSPDTRVLMVSMYSKIDYIVRSFQAGAAGYLAKESAADMLIKGIEHVLNGDYFMDAKVSEKVVKKLAELPEKKIAVSTDGYESLTPREQEVMTLLGEGYSATQVAEKLFISPKTAENHRANIMRKLGLHSTIELIRYAAKIGIIDVDLWKE
ncbi:MULTISPECIES: response regulator [Desulfococcus]|uniref:Two component transcriptional regulator, LuxR family n=1 Tax=Desulfococcus multivorans DSM 2059 TaxID=1121405 RepID=S7TF66_DESML|nr:response regulator transcription factor [Desulfococcus multivorans]AOY59840.1 two component system response regulator, LuxR-type binding domain [Desulfococcus multivorans]AQV02006.1 DNA-binding response regulator [Desulfococcus multivorans]EPR35842.1 two component transcriptional regulator, LuxR family [Desulfococcus multivorans DSM 2059]MDX9818496.1 response regulator transcription factor [Desulfococcus multivorans]SJZ33997.1 two component transcriptional regulator, LuxR family [Desulfococ